MSQEFLFQSLNCTLTLKQPAPNVLVVELTGRDVNEFGEEPFRKLDAALAGRASVELYIDAREVTSASVDVSGAWARWLGAHKASFAHVSMLTGSRFIQISADLVKRFANMGETMRLYTDPAAFDEGLARSSAGAATLKHVTVGEGPRRVLVLHDWLGDHHNYDPMLPYLDLKTFTYVFADLRGYGLSRDVSGSCDLREAAADVRALGGPRFSVVAHSMSTLVAQQVLADAGDRVQALVLITPIVPSGMGAPPEVVEYLEAVGGDESLRRASLESQWGKRLSARWLDFKLQRWAASARPEAVRAYARMFSTGTVVARSERPVLAIVGEHDNEPFREKTVREGMAAAYPKLELWTCANAGHYPMEETPVALASRVERFLTASSDR